MRYEYRALNREGHIVTGVLEAVEQRQAMRDLERQGLTPVTVVVKAGKTSSPGRMRAAKGGEVLLVMHQLTTLLRAGVSLDEAVASLAESQEQPLLAQELQRISTVMRQGVAFSAALRESAIKLPAYMYYLAEAGELTGNLAGALRDGVAQMEYDRTIANELRNALIYPAILIFSGVGAVMLIFLLVVPKFSKLLDKSDVDVPFLAQAVLGIGQFFHDNVMLLGGLLLVLVVAGTSVLSRPAARRHLWDFMTGVPLLGPWLLEADIGRWASMLATLLASKVELTRALELAQQGVSSGRLKANFAQVAKAVRGGSGLANALRESDAITATGYGLIKVGERSGDLPGMLRSLATLYVESGRDRMKGFLALLEPVAILSIGGVIGLIMTGIILAITSVNDISL